MPSQMPLRISKRIAPISLVGMPGVPEPTTLVASAPASANALVYPALASLLLKNKPALKSVVKSINIKIILVAFFIIKISKLQITISNKIKNI